MKAAGLLDRRAGVGAIAMHEGDLFQGEGQDEADEEENIADFLEATLEEDEDADEPPERAALRQSDA